VVIEINRGNESTVVIAKRRIPQESIDGIRRRTVEASIPRSATVVRSLVSSPSKVAQSRVFS
jgi:hypothetical protein